MNTDITFMQFADAGLKLTMIILIGLYFIFSNTIMSSLKRFDNGASVMVEINKQILNPLFMGCFIVSGAAGIYLMVWSQGYEVVSGALFFFGTTVVTALKSVPLNNKLLELEGKEEQQQMWLAYLERWVFWNHIRSVCGIFSGFFLVL